jgi:general stress protein 26
MADEPRVARVRFPSDYGARGGEADELLPWSWAEERLVAAKNYWLSTVSAEGKPHARPVDGVWVDGALCFGGSPETRWVRHLQANPALSVHLPSDEEAIILEGDVEYIEDAAHPLAAPLATANRAKYPQYYEEGGETPPLVPFWCLRPRVVYAWTLTGFPNRATRWTFEGR